MFSVKRLLRYKFEVSKHKKTREETNWARAPGRATQLAETAHANLCLVFLRSSPSCKRRRPRRRRMRYDLVAGGGARSSPWAQRTRAGGVSPPPSDQTRRFRISLRSAATKTERHSAAVVVLLRDEFERTAATPTAVAGATPTQLRRRK